MVDLIDLFDAPSSPPGDGRSSRTRGGGGDDDDLSVDAVRLGSSFNDGGDDRCGVGGDKDPRRSRKKSPLQKIPGADCGRVLPSGGDGRQSSSRRRKQQQQHDMSQQRRQSTTGRGRYGASQGSGHQQKEDERGPQFGAAPWAQMKKDVGRRSREAGKRLRRSLSCDKNRVSRAFDSDEDEDVTEARGDVLGRGDMNSRRASKGERTGDGRQDADRRAQERKKSGRQMLSHSLSSQDADRRTQERKKSGRRMLSHSLGSDVLGNSSRDDDKGHSGGESVMSRTRSAHQLQQKGASKARSAAADDMSRRLGGDPARSNSQRKSSEFYRPKGKNGSSGGHSRASLPQREIGAVDPGGRKRMERRASKALGGSQGTRRRMSEIPGKVGGVTDRTKNAGRQAGRRETIPVGGHEDISRRKSKDILSLPQQEDAAKRSRGSGRQADHRDSKSSRSGHDVVLRRKSKEVLDLLQQDFVVDKSKGPSQQTARGESKPEGCGKDTKRRKSKDRIDLLEQDYVADKAPHRRASRRDSTLGGSGHEKPRRKSKDSLDLLQHDVIADQSKDSHWQTARRESKLERNNHDTPRRNSKDRIDLLQQDDVDKSKESVGQAAHSFEIARRKSRDTLDLLQDNVVEDTNKGPDQQTAQGESKLERNNHDTSRRKSKDRIGLHHQDDLADESDHSIRQAARRDSELAGSDYEIATRQPNDTLDLLQQDSAADENQSDNKQIDSKVSKVDSSGHMIRGSKSEVADKDFSNHSHSPTSQPDRIASDDSEGSLQLGDILRNEWEERKRLSMVLEDPDPLASEKKQLDSSSDNSMGKLGRVQDNANGLPWQGSDQDLEALSKRDPEREARRGTKGSGTPRRSSESTLINERVLPLKRENKKDQDAIVESKRDKDSHGRDDDEPKTLAAVYAKKVQGLSSDQVLRSSKNLITRMGTLANSVTDSLTHSLTSSYTERLQKECQEENDPCASAAASGKSTAAISKSSAAAIDKKPMQQGIPEQDLRDRRAGRLASSLSKGYSLVKRSSRTVKKPKNRRSSNSLLIFEEDELRGSSSLRISDDEAVISDDDYRPSFDEFEQEREKNEDDLLEIKWVRDSFKKEKKVAANTETSARAKESLEDDDAVLSPRKKSQSKKNDRQGTSVTEDPSDVDGENSTLNSKGSADISKDSKISIIIPRESSAAKSDEGMLMNDERDKKSYGLHLTPIMMCIMCFCYVISLLVVGAMGFWLHMYATKRVWSSSSGNHSFGPKSNDEMVTGVNQGLAQPFGNDDDSETKPGKIANVSPTTFSTPLPPPTLLSSLIPSIMPSTSFPSPHPSEFPSATMQPSSEPSDLPSTSPTSTPGCPEQLLKSVSLSDDSLLTMKYDVVTYPTKADVNDVGGLLCASVEYGGEAGWIGIAFSEASRDPKFGRKEAVIGIPGISTSAVVATGGIAGLGQQIAALGGGPMFVNPGKYNIPAGGIETGYYGPSLRLLSDIEMQTLINGSISMNSYQGDGVLADQLYTKMSFVKYLREPNNIEIDPYGTTLFLYAISTLDGSGGYDNNPEWKFTYLNLLDNDLDVAGGHVRKRERRHTSA